MALTVIITMTNFMHMCTMHTNIATVIITWFASSGVDPGGARGVIAPPNKNIPGRVAIAPPNKNIPGQEYLFAPSKF